VVLGLLAGACRSGQGFGTVHPCRRGWRVESSMGAGDAAAYPCERGELSCTMEGTTIAHCYSSSRTKAQVNKGIGLWCVLDLGGPCTPRWEVGRGGG
jgi:hypothetical protein